MDAGSVEIIINAFRDRGDRSYGEDVTELEHAMQTAEFAKQFGEPDAIVLSCLLHDYGHMLHDLGEDIAHQGVYAQHEELGAKLLQGLFPEHILDPIRLHVAAKRYLCWKELNYIQGLSASSLLSLQLQGGPMSDLEATAFAALPHYQAAVQVRRYYDMGKVPGMKTASLESYRALIEKFLL